MFVVVDEVRVAVLSVKGIVMIWSDGIGMWRKVTMDSHSLTPHVIKVTTNSEIVNVGFNCKEGESTSHFLSSCIMSMFFVVKETAFLFSSLDMLYISS